jgi:flagellar hook-associated protein 2
MASTVAPATGPVFSAGGLASGLDTASIVDALTAIATQPITDLQTAESATQTQISSLADMAARLTSFKNAVDLLGQNGALGVKVTSTNSAFTATASATSTAGSFQIGVSQLATAARSRTQAFDSATAPVTGGTLAFNVNGSPFSVTIDDGEALSDVAFAINQSGAPVSATILNDGINSYLSISNRSTGFPLGGTSDQALSFVETSTGALGKPLALASIATAKNALFTVDGLNFTRTTNTFSDAVPGTTITLNGLTPPNVPSTPADPTTGDLGTPGTTGDETLSLDTDTTTTQQNLQSFVDAYNGVMSAIHTQFAITGTTDTSTTLAHDPAMRALQSDMANIVMSTVGTGPISSLAALGIETGEDGSLSLDTTILAKAMSSDPTAVNSIFQDATAGLAKTVDSMVQSYTDPVNGMLTLDSQGLTSNISRMDDQISSLQLRVNAYHDMLLAQFTNMETIVSNMKSVGSFLTQQEAKSS